MPADSSLELFDVVCPSTGEPLLVSESGAVVEEGSGAETRRGGDSVEDDAKGETSRTSTTSTASKRLTVPRGLAHANGTWHASVYVHLSRARDGAFLLQRRSARKDVCPRLWDLACAEHVASGETRLEAALRGLGVAVGLGPAPGGAAAGVSAERLGRPLGPPRQAVLRIEGPPLVWDREVVTSYWLRDFFEEARGAGGGGGGGGGNGEKPGRGGERGGGEETIKFDEDEVSEIRWVLPAELKKETEGHPERFTPWFLAELRARPELLP